MNCDRINQLTADYLGHELDAESRRRFEAHLQTCEACRSAVAELLQTQSILQSLETVDDEAAAARTRNLRIVRVPRTSARLGLTLLKTAAVLALGVLLGHFLPSPERQTTRPANPGRKTASVVVEGVHPRWLALASRLGAEPVTLADQLTILAESRRQ